MGPFVRQISDVQTSGTTPGSVVEQRVEVVLRQALAALEEVELDDERTAADLAAELLDEPRDRLHGAAGGEDVVVDHDPRPGLNRLRVQLEHVLAVLEPVARADRL